MPFQPGQRQVLHRQMQRVVRRRSAARGRPRRGSRRHGSRPPHPASGCASARRSSAAPTRAITSAMLSPPGGCSSAASGQNGVRRQRQPRPAARRGQALPFAEALLDQIGLDRQRGARIAGGEDRLGGAPRARQRRDAPQRRAAAGAWPAPRYIGACSISVDGHSSHVHRAVQDGARVLVHQRVADQPEISSFADAQQRAAHPRLRGTAARTAATAAASHTTFSPNAQARWSHRIDAGQQHGAHALEHMRRRQRQRDRLHPRPAARRPDRTPPRTASARTAPTRPAPPPPRRGAGSATPRRATTHQPMIIRLMKNSTSTGPSANRLNAYSSPGQQDRRHHAGQPCA